MSINYVHKYFPFISKEKRDNLKIDPIGLYSISTPKNAEIITGYIKKYYKNSNVVVTDAMAGVGGNTLSFASALYHVNAIELDESRSFFLISNLSLYKQNNVLCINADYFTIMHRLKQDIIFLDPPWGGKSYKDSESMTIQIGERTLESICDEIYENKLCSMLLLKLPLNYDIDTFSIPMKQIMIVERLQKILIIIVLC